MLEGLSKYISQQIKDPVYSEVYWVQSAAGIASKTWPLSEKIKGIYTNSIFISTENALPITFTDKFGRVLFVTGAAAGAFTIAFPFWYYFPGNIIQVTAAPVGVSFSISYQTITEHKLNRGGQ